MEQQRITHTFYLSLIDFLMSAKQQIFSIGDSLGLTSIQAITLLLIDENRPRPMKNFCLLFHCDASNVTGIVDGLEKKGLVSRQNDPMDRRIKVIQLEPTGKQVQQSIIRQLDSTDSLLLSPLNDSEKQQFVHIIDKIAKAKSQQNTTGSCNA